MPAGLFDEGESGMPEPPGAGQMMGGGAGLQDYSQEELKTALAQIMAKNAPQGQGQPSPEDLWALQGKQQGLGAMPQPSVPASQGPYGQNQGTNIPMAQGAPGGMGQPVAPIPNAAWGGGPPGVPGMGDPSNVFPGAQSFNLGAKGQGAFDLPKSIRYGRR